MLELRNVRKKYYSSVILGIPFLALENGIYWIKGANGSGKTTLLKMMAGLIPFGGEILFKGISLVNQPLEYRKQVSWSEAEPLYPNFITGLQLIELYRSIRKAPRQDVDNIIDLFSMGSYIGNPIGGYSSGMIKKLSLALAFIGSPPLVILDEPLITLDPESLNLLCAYILKMHTTDGTSFLLSSHQDLDTSLLNNAREIFVANKTVSKVV